MADRGWLGRLKSPTFQGHIAGPVSLLLYSIVFSCYSGEGFRPSVNMKSETKASVRTKCSGRAHGRPRSCVYDDETVGVSKVQKV